MSVVANDTVDKINIDCKELEKIFDRAKKPRIRLENWQWNGMRQLAGNAVNHPRLGNAFIITSRIIHFDEQRSVAETLNTLYELGSKA